MTATERDKDHSNRLTGIQIMEFSGNRSSRQKIGIWVFQITLLILLIVLI